MSDAAIKDFTELLDMPAGTDLGSSDWYTVTQDDIDTFATLTKDEDPYHIDPEWARENSPLGTTISFGFLTVASLLFWGIRRGFEMFNENPQRIFLVCAGLMVAGSVFFLYRVGGVIFAKQAGAVDSR